MTLKLFVSIIIHSIPIINGIVILIPLIKVQFSSLKSKKER